MNNCACIKKEAQGFDFSLDSYDCKGLLFIDTTNWMVDDNYSLPDTFDITVVLPSKNDVKVTLKPNTTNKISAKDLGFGACLPDGIYCFKTESCGYKYSRNKAVVCTLKCRLHNLIAKSEDWHTINKIKNLIEAIEVSAEMGLELQAQNLFKVVQKELDILECFCTCN